LHAMNYPRSASKFKGPFYIEDKLLKIAGVTMA